MKIEVGKVYETRDGRLARVICTDRKNTNGLSVIAIIANNDGSEWCYIYHADGTYAVGEGPDLIREHVPVTYRWHNIYPSLDIGVGWHDCVRMNGSIGIVKLAFDPSGNLIPDKCEITGAQPNG